jgi:polysaccharide export outer membrane protein
MRSNRHIRVSATLALLLCCGLNLTGCQSQVIVPSVGDGSIPRELSKVSLPEYVLEPPDILLIDAVRVVPKPPYKIEPLDVIYISVPNVLPGTEPITGLYSVEPEGTVTLGEYGTVVVSGLTIKEAVEAVKKQLKIRINDPKVDISLGQSRAMQLIRGEHLVRPDGTVGFGTYGSVHVTGLTISAAKAAIEEHLSKFLQRPEISLEVYAFNSKVCYVIFDGGGYGQQIYRLPITGNETVLDAVAQVSGLTAVSSKHHIHVARPAPAGNPEDQIMDVDWVGVTTRARTETNYQLLPGDRVYIDSDCWVRLDTKLARVLTPIERVFGFTLLGSGTVFNIAENTGVGKFTKGASSSTGGSGGF